MTTAFDLINKKIEAEDYEELLDDDGEYFYMVHDVNGVDILLDGLLEKFNAHYLMKQLRDYDKPDATSIKRKFESLFQNNDLLEEDNAYLDIADKSFVGHPDSLFKGLYVNLKALSYFALSCTPGVPVGAKWFFNDEGWNDEFTEGIYYMMQGLSDEGHENECHVKYGKTTRNKLKRRQGTYIQKERDYIRGRISQLKDLINETDDSQLIMKYQTGIEELRNRKPSVKFYCFVDVSEPFIVENKFKAYLRKLKFKNPEGKGRETFEVGSIEQGIKLFTDFFKPIVNRKRNPYLLDPSKPATVYPNGQLIQVDSIVELEAKRRK